MTMVDFVRGHREYFEDFITRSTYHSNALEGSTLSYAETYAVIFNDNSITVKAEPRELYEAINHKYALDLVLI
jgi:Fic family protein